MTSLRTLAILAALALTTACYPQAKGDALEQRLLTVEARQDEFRSTFDAERQRLAELALAAEQSIAELEEALQQAQRFLQRTNADLGVRVDGLEQQLAELRGRIEEGGFQTAQLRQELELLRQDIEIRLSNLR